MALKLDVERVFCLTLRNAALIAGFLSALVALVYIGDLVLALIQFGQYDPGHIHIDFRNTLFEIYLQICIYLLVLFSGLLLIFGIQKKCHHMFVPWLAVAAFFILIGVVSIGVLILFGFDDISNNYGFMFFLSSLGVVLLTGLGVYFWIGVFSLFKQIRNENIQETRNPNNFERLYGSQEQARETSS